MLKIVTFIALLAAAAVQGMSVEMETEVALKDKITQSLEALLESEAMGIENCENKCDKAFNRMAYQISAADGRRTFEFEACVMGCNKCSADLAKPAASASNCFNYCKNYDWKGNNMLKGVIEPDKACMGGCVINTCQAMCKGGTTANTMTNANKKFFYPNGGCSIKTEPYSQNLQYVPWNSPNTGQGGSEAAASCCSNALSLCEYVGSTSSTNYKNLLVTASRECKGFVASGSKPDICKFFNNPQNCGSTST